MKKLLLCVLALIAPTCVPLRAQKLPEFDAVSVKSPAPNDGRSMWMSTPDGVRMTNIPLRMILQSTFGVQEDQIVGAPAWVGSTNFDIDAKVAPEDADRFKKLTRTQHNQMLQSILAERFGLKFHTETRDLPVYELVVAKGGPKLKQAELLPADPATNAPARGKGAMRMQPGKLIVEGVPIGTVASILSGGDTGRTVIDKTGLTGFYDFTLEWVPEGGMRMNGAPAPPPPPGSPEASIFTAVQEQLGLKLEPRKDPLQVIVIDHIEKPTAN